MKMVKQISAWAIVGLIAIIGVGCAQNQANVGQAQPIDSLSVDGRIDQLQVGANNLNSVAGEDMSSTNSLDEMGKALKAIYFEFDKFDLSSSMEDLAQENAQTLNRSTYAQSKVKLQGNADEWGTDEYNYALGLKRAKAVKDYLVSEGVLESRISIISFGESNPACTQRTQECWSANRRVEFKLLP